MNEENNTLNQSTNPAETEPQGKESLELIPPERLKENAKAVYEQILEQQRKAKETYDAINGQVGGLENLFSLLNRQLESLIQDFDTLEAQLKTAKYQNKLGDNYAAWFAALCQIQSSNPYDKNTELNDTLIRLSREMSRQKLDFEQKKKDADDLDGEIAGKQDELNELNRRIDSEYREKCKAKEDEIAAIDKQIKEKKDELEDLKRQIEDGSMLPPEPLDPDSLTKYEAACIEEFDREGFIVPNDRNGEIYLCGEFGYVDITGLTQIGRERLMNIDQEAEDPDQNLFRYMGRPQFLIKKVQSGMYKIMSQSPHYPNTVDGEPLSCSEEMDLRQGAVIEMTDNKKKTQKVKVFISPK